MQSDKDSAVALGAAEVPADGDGDGVVAAAAVWEASILSDPVLQRDAKTCTNKNLATIATGALPEDTTVMAVIWEGLIRAAVLERARTLLLEQNLRTAASDSIPGIEGEGEVDLMVVEPEDREQMAVIASGHGLDESGGSGPEEEEPAEVEEEVEEKNEKKGPGRPVTKRLDLVVPVLSLDEQTDL
jgi:hypothetical protein